MPSPSQSPTPTSPTLHPPPFTTCTPQETSPLFTVLPPEIRHEIFSYALSSYEDPDPAHAYARETYWRRPGHSAPRRTDTALLRTCKQAYLETWFMPFALAEHTIYLTAVDRAPPLGPRGGRISVPALKTALSVIHRAHFHSTSMGTGTGTGTAQGTDDESKNEAEGENDDDDDEGMPIDIETGPVRIFAQLWILQPGSALSRVLSLEHFAPRLVTLTIRYTDFWHWEDNRPLFVHAEWVRMVVFPASVTTFVIEFESLERRREEVDIVAGQAVEKWVFRRRDGKTLKARGGDETTVQRWSGSSMFGGRRWVRDETRPGVLDYYVLSVPWRVSNDQEQRLVSPDIRVPDDFVQPPVPFQGGVSLTKLDMRMAGVTVDTPAQEAVDLVREARSHRSAMRARTRSIGRAWRMEGIMRGRGRGSDLI